MSLVHPARRGPALRVSSAALPPHVPNSQPLAPPRHFTQNLDSIERTGGSTGRTSIASPPAGAQLASAPTDLWSLPLPSEGLLKTLERLKQIQRELESLPSLAPSPKVNGLFTELVNLTADADDTASEAILEELSAHDALPRLRELCAQGEALLESHWQHRIIESEDAQAELRAFPYHQNYEDLTRMEVKAIEIASGSFKPQRLLFIGSGPLPLTPLMLARDYEFKVDNLDVDASAVREGEALARRLGVGRNQMRFAHTDVFGLSSEELAKYDGFYVAALAGVDPREKDKIFERLAQHAKPGALLVARSAFRLRKLLYPEVQPERLKGFAPQVLVHPLNDVVNSVVVARKNRPADGLAS